MTASPSTTSAHPARFRGLDRPDRGRQREPVERRGGRIDALTVNVTPGLEPSSTGLAVTGDLTTIGGAPNAPFFDDGTNGDVTAGDNIFTCWRR
jgi:hypothetical protein